MKCAAKTVKEYDRCRFLLANGGCTKPKVLMCVELTGEEIREYIHVIDAARLSVNILKPEFENQSVIITGTQTLTSKELLITIKEMLAKDIKINFLNKNPDHHYGISPYVFSPKVAKKLVSNFFVDIGQGLLEMAEEIYKRDHKDFRQVLDWYIKGK